MCPLHFSGPYRGALRSSWAILSCVTRRPPGTWGSWWTRRASGSISTLITLEEVHTDTVRQSSVGKHSSLALARGCPQTHALHPQAIGNLASTILGGLIAAANWKGWEQPQSCSKTFEFSSSTGILLNAPSNRVSSH